MLYYFTNKSIGEQVIIVSKDNDKYAFFKQAFIFYNRAETEQRAQNDFGMIVNLIMLINLSLKVPDMVLIKNIYYAAALFFEHSRDFKNSIYSYTKLRSAAEGDEDFEGWCISFMRRGEIYIAMQEYQYALRSYKLMLTYSWILKNVEYEILAYKGIAHWYYYQGLMK